MKVTDKKDYIIVALLFVIVAGIGFLLSNRHQRLMTEYPTKPVILETEDFLLHHTKADILIGQSSWEEVTQVYPRGKTLGMSSVYRPEGLEATFTFTQKSNILSKVDIHGTGLSTFRGVNINDSFAKVVKQYGQGYVRSYVKNDPATFDAIFGSEHYIVFHIEDNIVKKIVLDYQAEDNGK